MITKTEHTDEYDLTYRTDDHAKQKCWELCLAWFKEHEHFTGESIQQSDITSETAPELLCEIAEKAFEFKHRWKE